MMNGQQPGNLEHLAERTTALEELFTHLQREVQSLSEAVIDLHRRVDSVAAKLLLLEQRAAADADDLGGDPIVEEGPPPHY